MKIAIDLEGFSAQNHREILQNIQSVCKESNVIEADHRSERRIDAVTIGVACGVISAVCSIVALGFQAAEYRRKKNETTNNDVLTYIRTVEAAQGEKLPSTIRETITRVLESQKQPVIIELEIEHTKYVVKAYGDEGAAMLQGRIKSQ
ncbi:MAG: hypothetical protein KAT52_04210 [Desulfobacterales bacterium]|nr:hypothetical protein [Desulfobacterales bacterium]